MKDDTRLVAAGRNPPAHYGAVNVPVYRASTILHETVAEMDAANAARARGEQVTVYGSSGTPTVFGFANSGEAAPDSLAHATLAGPQMLTGGGAGPEGSVLTTAAALLFIALLRLMHPNKGADGNAARAA